MSQHAPEISVIIPTYNRPDFLTRSAKSALSQSFADIEVIAIDDCSPANYEAACAELSDPRFRYIRLEKNQGAAGARNAGVREARGRFIAFLDDDDWWETGKLASQMNFIAGAALKDAGNFVLFSMVRRLKLNWLKEVAPVHAPRPEEDILEYRFARRGLIHLSTVLLPRTLARDVPFDTDLPRNEDILFFSMCQHAGARFFLCPEVHATLDFRHTQGRLRMGGELGKMESIAGRLAPYTSPKGLLGYRATFIAPRLAASSRPGESLRLITGALAQGALSPKNAAICTLNAALGWIRSFRSRGPA